jgi:hypothetical protein
VNLFVVISEAHNGGRSARRALAGDDDRARHTRLEH